jgi:phosphohistidine phosphatase SixA
MIRSLCAALLFLSVTAGAASAQPVIYLVRHAERADAGMAAAKTTGSDPELSAAGKSRATALAEVLRDARISAVYSTEYKRSRDTAEPLARAAGIAVTVVSSNDAAGLVEKMKSATGNVLIVGHSNTVPGLIKALGVDEPVTIAEDEYDRLFVVVRGAPATLLSLRYRQQ